MHWRSEVLKIEGVRRLLLYRNPGKEENLYCVAVAVVMERIRGLGGEIDGNW